jgi:hypothetical protein
LLLGEFVEQALPRRVRQNETHLGLCSGVG